jgi:hypothetical protein
MVGRSRAGLDTISPESQYARSKHAIDVAKIARWKNKGNVNEKEGSKIK